MLGEACALLAALVWSVSVVLFKRSESVSPQAMNLFKNVTALLLLAVTMPVLGLGIDWHRSSEDWWRLALSGVLGIALADTLVFMALRRLGASLLAVVDCVYAPMIVALSVAFLHEPLSAKFLVGAVLVVVGVLIATSQGQRGGFGRQDRPRRRLWAGIGFGIAGFAAMAACVVIAKPALERGHLVEVTLIRLVAGVLAQLCWIAARPTEYATMQVFRPGPVWRTLLPASVLGSYVGMLLWLGGFKWTSASTASVLNQLTTVFTIVLAWIFLGERITGRRAVGGAVAIGGALVVLLWRVA